MRFLPGFYDVFDDMFDDGWISPSTNAMQCDIKEVDNNYEMNIALPGYKKEDISLDLTDGYLTVSANTNQDKEEKDKNGKVISSYEATDDKFLDKPMVVIVNGESASASEVFTGAMKDHGVATIVGENTFGKGIVQSVIPLQDGSAVKLTTAKYFTPNGNDIHKKGIAPDVEVSLPDDYTADDYMGEKDTQFNKAVEVIKEEIK